MLSINTIDFFNKARSHQYEAEKSRLEGDSFGEWFHEKEASGYYHTYRIQVRNGRCAIHPDDNNSIH